MRSYWLVPASVALLGAALFPVRSGADDGADRIAHLFQSRCASCHFVPDPDLATDLAWLDQVNRTS